MSRNNMFLILACAIAVTVLSGSPSPLARSSSVRIVSLIAPPADGMYSDPAIFQQSFDHQ